jgi:uncharacterized protein
VIIAVLDTNVLASGFVGLTNPASVPGELLRRWREKAFTLVVSEHILGELTRVFGYSYFVHRLSSAEIAAAMVGLRTEATIQPATVHVAGVAAHPQDDAVIATALSAQARYLVTGAKPLLTRGPYRGTVFLSPRQFLNVLE